MLHRLWQLLVPAALVATSLAPVRAEPQSEDGLTPSSTAQEAGSGTRVVLRVKAWEDFTKGDGIYRVLFSEVAGDSATLAEPQNAPPNAFELAFEPEDWPEPENGFYRFDFAVKPGTYAVSFVFWADQTGATTAVGQSVTNRKSLHFTVKAGASNYLGDLRLRFGDIQAEATRVIAHIGHGLAEDTAELRQVQPDIAQFTCPEALLGASRRTCMRRAMESQEIAAPQAAIQ